MRKTLFPFTLAVAGFLFGQTAPVSGYALEGQKWPDGFITMNLQLGSGPISFGELEDGTDVWNNVAQAALDDWNQYLNKVQFISNTTTLTPKSGDRINTVFFSSSAFGKSFGADAIAVTIRWYIPATGAASEADVVVNTAYDWNSYRGSLQQGYYGSPTVYDLRRVLDHEFGHVLGLDHPDLANPPQNVVAIMNSVISDLDHIEVDDINGVADLYGSKPFLAPIAVNSSPSGSGFVAGGGNFQVGSTQQLIAVSAPAHTLAHWDDGSTNPTRSIVVPLGGITCTAVFKSSLDNFQVRYNFDYLNGVLYANNQFYAFGFGQGAYTTLTSPDGATWTPHPSPTSPYISSSQIAYGNGKFVVVSGNNIYTSPDAITWTKSGTSIPNNGNRIAFGNGVFVVTGPYGSSNMFYSTDGINWSFISFPNLATVTPQALTYGNGHFIVMGEESGSTNVSLVSTDGINWTSGVISAFVGSSGFNTVTASNGIYIATGRNGNVILHSTDGLHWQSSTFPGANTYEGDIDSTAYGDGVFIAVTDYEVLTSADGATWSLEPVDGVYNASVVYGDNFFVVAGTSELVQSGSLSSTGSLTQQTISFPAIGDQTYGGAPITLNATATSLLPVMFSVASGPATITGQTLTVTGAGTVVVAAHQFGNTTTYAAAPDVTTSFTVNPAPLTITAKPQNKATGQAYDFTGTEFTAGGLQNGDTIGLVQLTSDGALASASIVGSPYPILASDAGGGTFAPANYTISYVSGALSVTGPKVLAKVTLGNLAATYDGTAKQVTVTTTPPGLDVDVTYDGSNTAPTTAGSYTVVATVNDPHYSGTVKGALIISKATAAIVLGNLAATYDGTPKSVTPTPTPSGLNVTITYGGKTTVPVNAGNYAVAAAITDANYTGSAKGTLVISKATAFVTINQQSLAAIYTGKAITATATTTPPGLPVVFTYTYNGKAMVPVNASTFPYAVVATVNTSNAAGSASGSLYISPATATVTFGNLAFTYTGKAHPATATTVPAKLPVTFTYNGGATAPSAIGTYPVVATVGNPNYTASTASNASTLTIGPTLPLVTTGAATGIGPAGATLSATANPETSDTMVSFQYGTTTSYGNTTTAQDAGGGAATVTLSTVLSVPAQTTAVTYHYRVVATNAAGSAYGVDRTFATPAIPGIVMSPEAEVGASGAEINLSVNPAGLAMTVSVQYGPTTDYGTIMAMPSPGSGKLPVNLFGLFPGLDPGKTYHYQVVMKNAQGTIYGPDETFTTLGFETRLVVEKGEGATGTSTPPTFASFGNPAVNADDTVALTGTLTLASGVTSANDVGIWTIDKTNTQNIIAQTGGNFLTLSDPVFNDSGAVAFRGTLKPLAGQVTAANATGIWLASTGTAQPVARQGSSANGTNGTFATFTSLGLTESAGVVFSAMLNAGSGITAANNSGIWEGTSLDNLTSLLQSGQMVDGKTIAKLNFLPTDTYVGGQTRSFASNGDIVCGAIFTDKTTGLVKVINGTPPSPSAFLQSQSSDTGISGATFATFGPPIINDSDRTAFAATLTATVGGVTTANNSGIWADDGNGTRQLIARTGSDTAPGTTAGFASFSDPLYNNNEAVAFRATLKVASGQATATTATGIWATDGSPNSLAIVAQQGKGQAPGCPAGATFATFTELALPNQGGANNTGGVIFLATLNTDAAADVTASNNTGIWAVDSEGALQLIVRTGDVLNGKTVAGLSFLPTLPVVNGQSRSFAQANGDLVYLATFSDKSSAVLSVTFP